MAFWRWRPNYAGFAIRPAVRKETCRPFFGANRWAGGRNLESSRDRTAFLKEAFHMIRFRTATAAAALLMLGTGSARATDQLIPGRRLSISDRAGRQRLAFVAKSPVIVAPTPQGSDDPTSVGATLRIVNPDSGESASLDLPSSRWTRNAAGTVYKFRNASAPAPPSAVKIALLRSGGLKVRARATGVTLNETF